MKEVHTLYKLIVLYLIEKIEFSLTNGQLWTFFAEEQYTDYFTLQETLVDMVETGLLSTETIRNSTHYTLTEQGQETLDFFENQIPNAIRNDIDQYLKKNKFALREENAVISDYLKTEKSEYKTSLIVKERGSELINIQITVPTEQQAIAICDKWQKKKSEIYTYLMRELL